VFRNVRSVKKAGVEARERLLEERPLPFTSSFLQLPSSTLLRNPPSHSLLSSPSSPLSLLLTASSSLPPPALHLPLKASTASLALTFLSLIYALFLPESAPAKRGAPGKGKLPSSCAAAAADEDEDEAAPLLAGIVVCSPSEQDHCHRRHRQLQQQHLEDDLSAPLLCHSTSSSEQIPSDQNPSEHLLDSRQPPPSHQQQQADAQWALPARSKPPSSSGWDLFLGSSWYLRLAVIWAVVSAMSSGVQVRRDGVCVWGGASALGCPDGALIVL
jgi:hypothetical protein